MAFVSSSTIGKIAAMWLPVFLFFAHGFEHAVVNMFVIPTAILMGADLSLGDWWLWNQIPVTIGNFIVFSPPPINNGIEVSGEYSLPIVILSIINASLASFTAISMNERIQKNSFFHRNFWLVLASLAMGFGIWSMHFVGMSALSLPFMMHYDSLLTCLSIIPSVIASFLAFYIVNQKKRSITTYLLSGIP